MPYNPRITTSFADVDISDDCSDNLRDNTTFYKICGFCGKDTLLNSRVMKLLQPFSKNKFYCGFCIRNDFNTKKNKDILIMSMRGIINYLYSNCYLIKEHTLYVSEIQDMINDHISCGLINPAFNYDPESYCWFLDFRKIGNQKITLNEVLDTCHDIVSCFNLYDNLKEFKGHKLLGKFDEAIIDFYKRRYRPEGKKILVPTLIGCITEIASAVKKEYRDFAPKELRIK